MSNPILFVNHMKTVGDQQTAVSVRIESLATQLALALLMESSRKPDIHLGANSKQRAGDYLLMKTKLPPPANGWDSTINGQNVFRMCYDK